MFNCLSVSYSHIPQQNGKWDGAAGNSNFYPDPDFVPKSQSNREHWSWRQILDYYKIDCIPFKNGYPVFPKNIVYAEISLKNFSNKPDTDNRKINFIQADKELARQKGWTEQEARSYRETETASTWHESEDCKTMQLVPIYVHNNIPHSGGIAQSKNL